MVTGSWGVTVLLMSASLKMSLHFGPGMAAEIELQRGSSYFCWP